MPTKLSHLKGKPPPIKSKKAVTPPSAPEGSYKDSFGITYLGSTAQVTVSRDIKLSRNYQSAGLHAGVSFSTPAEEAHEAVQKAAELLRTVMLAPLQTVSHDLDELGNETNR